MKVAVIGAGFAGLAASYFLLSKGFLVDLYDQKGVGAGASGIASGLLHPYIGEGAKRSEKATEALGVAKELLAVAQKFSIQKIADFSGLVRQVPLELIELFSSHEKEYGDVERLSQEFFLIKSGITVHSVLYLEGLYRACVSLGLTWHVKKISTLEELQGYDRSIFTLGAGIFSFPELHSLSLKPVKGQVLLCEWPSSLAFPKRTLVGKGHIIPLEEGAVHLGSTYERGNLDDNPCRERALVELGPKAQALVPGWENIKVKGCRAGVRVCSAHQYTPLLKEIRKNTWVLTALGSRGLLYHGYVSKAWSESL